ncbi:MAG: J domain-containing protein [Anaerolineales bacterium]
MFQKRNRGSLKQALERAGDSDLRSLEADVAERQERVAQLQFELSDTQADLGRFEREYEAQVGSLQQRLISLEAEVDQARLRAAHRAQWGDRADSPDFNVDAVEQFRRTWAPREKPPEPESPAPVSEETKAELKQLFRTLAKRFHPDLVTDPEEKRRREKVMVQINDAYAAQNLLTMKKVALKPVRPEAPATKTREQIIVDLKAEIVRLDRVVLSLERQLQELINSYTVRLMLEVSIAKRDGGNLLAKMAAEIRTEIASLEAELKALG